MYTLFYCFLGPIFILEENLAARIFNQASFIYFILPWLLKKPKTVEYSSHLVRHNTHNDICFFPCVLLLKHLDLLLPRYIFHCFFKHHCFIVQQSELLTTITPKGFTENRGTLEVPKLGKTPSSSPKASSPAGVLLVGGNFYETSTDFSGSCKRW